MEQIPLKPCPFCGGRANFEPRRGDEQAMWIVRCDRRFLPNGANALCMVNMRTHKHETQVAAATAWNTRSPVD